MFQTYWYWPESKGIKKRNKVMNYYGTHQVIV